MPAGVRVVLDPTTRRHGAKMLVGGTPRRVLRLSPAGRAAYDELQTASAGSGAARSLARYLTDAGLAHPRPVRRPLTASVTAVVPVRDRAALLDRCLRSLGTTIPVLVVDDGSADPARIGEVARRRGARVIRRETSGGPAAARNTALRLLDTDLVVMIDSDCVAPAGWVERLAAHLDDPAVGLAAPRVKPREVRTSAQRFAAVRGSLDLGAVEAPVAPLSRVAYVPSTALVARRAALADVAVAGEVFDERLRYGEDVDLVWRLHQRGWRVRYDPSVEVRHDEPATWARLLARRFRYGTSAAPLAERHPDATCPVVLPVLPAVVVGAAVARRPVLAAVAAGAGLLASRRARVRAGLPAGGSARDFLVATGQTFVGAGRYTAQFALPLAVAACASGPRGSMRRRIVATGALVLAPGLRAATSGGGPGPVRLVAGCLADDVAYGAGVWAGCIRARTLRPLLPKLVGLPDRRRGHARPFSSTKDQ
jgi:mycofactocin system glycosyltransferase